MEIRAATKQDVRALAELAQTTYADAFGASLRAADLRALLEKNLAEEIFARMVEQDTILVAERDGRMIGYVQFGKCEFEQANAETDYELRKLYVLRAFQNQGIGAQLLEAALNDARMKNAPRIFLDVWEHNHGAQRFYKRYGFQVVGERKFEVESGAETSADLVMARGTFA